MKKLSIFLSCLMLIFFVGKVQAVPESHPSFTTAEDVGQLISDALVGINSSISDYSARLFDLEAIADDHETRIVDLESAPGAGNIAFIANYTSRAYALTTDGKNWVWANDGRNWIYLGPTDIPDVPVDTENIVQWDYLTFLDSDGNVWYYDRGLWNQVGHP